LILDSFILFYRFYELKFRSTKQRFAFYVETFLLLRHNVSVSTIKRLRFYIEKFLIFDISLTVSFCKKGI